MGQQLPDALDLGRVDRVEAVADAVLLDALERVAEERAVAEQPFQRLDADVGHVGSVADDLLQDADGGIRHERLVQRVAVQSRGAAVQ